VGKGLEGCAHVLLQGPVFAFIWRDGGKIQQERRRTYNVILRLDDEFNVPMEQQKVLDISGVCARAYAYLCVGVLGRV
jgi:hypothetical protein